VAAYLVGARGTARHAVFLGLTTTITHTIGVFALGAVTLFVSNYILPEQLYPWLEFLSGALVVVIGVTLFRSRLAGGLRRPPTNDHRPTTTDQRLPTSMIMATIIITTTITCTAVRPCPPTSTAIRTMIIRTTTITITIIATTIRTTRTTGHTAIAICRPARMG